MSGNFAKADHLLSSRQSVGKYHGNQASPALTRQYLFGNKNIRAERTCNARIGKIPPGQSDGLVYCVLNCYGDTMTRGHLVAPLSREFANYTRPRRAVYPGIQLEVAIR